MRDEYPKPTVSQAINAWRLMLDLINIGYPHNFQAERSDLRDFCYDVSALIKRAYAIKEESEGESGE